MEDFRPCRSVYRIGPCFAQFDPDPTRRVFALFHRVTSKGRRRPGLQRKGAFRGLRQRRFVRRERRGTREERLRAVCRQPLRCPLAGRLRLLARRHLRLSRRRFRAAFRSCSPNRSGASRLKRRSAKWAGRRQCRREQGRRGLCAVGPVRASSPAHGRLGRVG